MKATVEVTTTVEIDVDDNVVLRCTENHTDDGKPATPEQDGWRDLLYDLDTPEKVFAHLAYNVVENGLALNQMDGWADLRATAMRVTTLGVETTVQGTDLAEVELGSEL